MSVSTTLEVNGKRIAIVVDDPNMPLLGACTVHVDNAAVRSCVLPIAPVSAFRAAKGAGGIRSFAQPPHDGVSQALRSQCLDPRNRG